MAIRKSFPLRISGDIYAAMRRWSDDELRSVNAQIEYVLREALRKAGRLKTPAGGNQPKPSPGGSG